MHCKPTPSPTYACGTELKWDKAFTSIALLFRAQTKKTLGFHSKRLNVIHYRCCKHVLCLPSTLLSLYIINNGPFIMRASISRSDLADEIA